MPFQGREPSYPFPAARIEMADPLPVTAFMPKLWAATGQIQEFQPSIEDFTEDLQAHGIIGGDHLYGVIVPGDVPFAANVISIPTANIIILDEIMAADSVGVIYKVGAGPPATTLLTARAIVSRGVSAYTLKFAKLWSDALVSAFNLDETGDIYWID